MKVKNKFNFVRKEFFKDVKKNLEANEITAEQPKFGRFQADSKTRMHLYVINAAFKMKSLVPESFPGACQQSASNSIKKCIEAEDVNRFIVLYERYYKRSIKPAIGSKTPKWVWGHLPIFVYAEKQLNNTEKQAAQNAMAIRNLIEKLGTAEQNMRDFHFKNETERLDHLRALTSFRDINIKLDPNLPNITDEERTTVLKHLAEQVSYLYQDRDRRNMFFVPDAQAIKDACAAGSKEARVCAQLSSEDKAEFDNVAFRKLQKTVNNCSAASPEWQLCVESLDLTVEGTTDAGDQENTVPIIKYRGLELLPWQPEAATFMLQMINGPLGGCINGYDTGLGKTVSTYVTIVQHASTVTAEIRKWDSEYAKILTRARSSLEEPDASDQEVIAATGLQEEIDQLGSRPKHKPVIIFAPSSAITAWSSDAAKYFNDEDKNRNIRLRMFHGRGTGKHSRTADMSSEQLKTCVNDLDGEDEATSRTCFLTTLATFRSRCLTTEEDKVSDGTEPGMPASGNQEKSPGQPENETFDPEALENAPSPGLEKEAPVLNIPEDLFGLRVVDEGHLLRNASSQQAKAIQALKCKTIVCTATVFINSVRDFRGILLLLWSRIEHRFRNRTIVPNESSFIAMRDSFRDKYKRNLFAISKPDEYLWFLEPGNFKKLLGSGAGPVDPLISESIVPLPLMLCCIRRIIGDDLTVAGKRLQVGVDIPPFRSTVVELRPCAVQASLYNAAHEEATIKGPSDRTGPALDGDDDEDDLSKPLTKWSVLRRRLQHAAFQPDLDQMHKRSIGANAAKFRKWIDEGRDAFSVFHTWTKSQYHHPIPATRIDMAWYIAGISCKIQALCAEILEVVIEEKEKLLIFAYWPLEIWIIELLLTVLQFNYASIRSGVSKNSRQDAEYEFNNDDNLQILVCSTSTAAESINLQQGGHRTVVVDMTSMMKYYQIIGRTFRIGQKSPPEVKLLLADGTFDQLLFQKYVSHLRSTIAATAELEPSNMELQEIENFLSASGMPERESKDYRVFARQKLREAKVDGLARSMFGVRSSITESWANIADLTEKNLDPEQRLFRLAHGGEIAREVLYAWRNHELTDHAPEGTGEELTSVRETPFAPGMLARVCPEKEYPDNFYVKAFVDAARDWYSDEVVFQHHGITVPKILEEVKRWVNDPSPHLDTALEHVLSGMSDSDLMDLDELADEADDLGYVIPREAARNRGNRKTEMSGNADEDHTPALGKLLSQASQLSLSAKDRKGDGRSKSQPFRDRHQC